MLLLRSSCCFLCLMNCNIFCHPTPKIRRMLNLACVGPGSFSFGMADDTVVASTHKLGRVGKRMHEAAVAPASDGDVVGDVHVAVGSVHYMQDVLDVDAPCVLLYTNSSRLDKLGDITHALKSRGYVTQAQVLDSMNFGGCAIQKKRLYVIGTKPTASHPTRRFTWPKLFESSPRHPNITMSDVFDTPMLKRYGYPLRTCGRGSPIQSRANWEHYEATDGTIWRIDTHHAALMLGFDEDAFDYARVSRCGALKVLANTVCPSVAAALVTQLRCVVLCVAGG